MGAGRATGRDREYQVSCRDLLLTQYKSRGIRPYDGDGIDVPFDVGGAIRRIDVALIDQEDTIILAECRRRLDKTKLMDIDAFAHRVELIRKHTDRRVAGVFFTKKQFQIGVVESGAWEGIDVIVFGEGQTLQNFVLAYQLYDSEREKRLQQAHGYFTGEVRPSGSLSGTVGRIHTGRSINVGRDYNTANEWVECAASNEILSHPAAVRFRDELESAPTIAGVALHCVRGRKYNAEINGWEKMGPNEEAPRGRYNPPGEVVLYLCDSDRGVLRELSPESGKTLFLQDYFVDPNLLRIADFSASNLSELVKATFDFAENSNVEGRVGRADYIFSQAVARLVKDASFDGMIVPGVRGDSSCHYRNVVLFEVLEHWTEWSRREAGFRHVIVP